MILQSGFITPDVPGLTLPKSPRPDISDIIIKPFKHPNTQFYYSVDITELYERFMFDATVVKDFAYREQFLKAFMNVINGVSFKQWVYLQTEATTLSLSGMEFLLDTLRYIRDGQRSVNIGNWVGLIDAIGSGRPRANDIELLRCFFADRVDSEIYSKGCLSPDLTRILAGWTGHADGFKDLIITAGIIFGLHPKTTINNQSRTTPELPNKSESLQLR